MVEVTTFTITVHADRTELHTQAATDVEPAKALNQAIAALQHELAGLKACPAHSAEPIVDYAKVQHRFFKWLFHGHRQQVLATLGIEQEVLQEAVTSSSQQLLLRFIFRKNPELAQTTIENKIAEVAHLTGANLPQD